MWTRGRLRRIHTPPVPHVWRDTRTLQGSGAIPFNLPPLSVAMDPSDKRTWSRPVRFTT
jgi:hypothetical protein